MLPSTMWRVQVVASTEAIREVDLEILMRVEYVIHLRRMEDVCHYLRYYLLMSVYMIASIVLTEFLMMCRGQHLHLMKFVN